jgi:hypothetical protein
LPALYYFDSGAHYFIQSVSLSQSFANGNKEAVLRNIPAICKLHISVFIYTETGRRRDETKRGEEIDLSGIIFRLFARAFDPLGCTQR